MLLKQILLGISHEVLSGSTEIEVEAIAYDSRRVRPGFTFVCIEGFKTDGHQYIKFAIENGATAIVVQRDIKIDGDITVIKVTDTRYCLAYMSDQFYLEPSKKFKLIGVTGTKGKTTTTYMLKSILEKYNQKIGVIGTVANCIGSEVLPSERTTPESYDLQALFSEMVEKNVDSVVMEVSSHALDLHRVSCSDFDIGVFTNLSRDHLDFHKTFDNYLKAKIKLFDMCKTGFVNIDNQYGLEVYKNANCKMFTLSIAQKADIMAINVKTNQDNVEFSVQTPWGNGDICVNTPGLFSVYNALSAISVALLMGVPFETVVEGLKSIRVPGRAEIVETGLAFTTMIDYAHSPDSLENILSTVKAFAKGRVICMFGCGGDRDKTKRPIMGEISGRLADFSIITSDNPRTEDPETIISEIESGIKVLNSEYITITDRREAISYAIKNAKKDDVIVLAGKGHETYQIFKDKTIHFDEREVVAMILDEIKK